MPTINRAAEPPSDDKRWRIVQATMRRNGFRRDALIETLHSVQETFGYLDDPSLRYVAHALHVPPSQVFGVSTFYHLFTLKPAGDHTCVVCTGTACYIKGNAELLAQIAADYALAPGETTADNAISLMTARCLGACAIAPVTVLDGTVQGKAGPEAIMADLAAWKEPDNDRAA